ncbi:hypothetical protein EMPS_04814 [Entomortierella parvispora]|uniref:Kinetochore protein Spc24 n=1 Tax=Entomortierella parvispora TaxID=205924 RepID=A0A9P3LVV9_9FUNG|nr:hypothetical protein EMPS_04814 [Entomortierella parvispora]
MEEQSTAIPSTESSSTLISDIGAQFHRSGADLQNIQKCFQDVRETEKVRQEMLRDARTLLQKLSRNLQLSRSKGSREHVDPESLNHDDQIVDMDKQQFAVAKGVQEMDQEIASLQAEVQELRMHSLELDSNYSASGVDAMAERGTEAEGTDYSAATGTEATGSSTVDSSSAHRRRISRNDLSEIDEDMLDEEQEILSDRAHAMAVLRLQIYRSLGIEMLENDVGAYTKARVRSLEKNEVHLVYFDDKLSPFYQTNLIWEFAS